MTGIVKSRTDRFRLTGSEEGRHHGRKQRNKKVDAADYNVRAMVCAQSCAVR